ncbi:hypothetical protein SAMN05660748_3152 [Blastococcus aggregatus]|uniref:PD-(D/E)XK nuclease superfamily protein n=2 Tax=Blastococcus aggregatus TaxID=38502 RepID=A0A285V8H0_9ACTN|nr:hypothetical protein SAMN05660748_3152 [Blastococcus aggregatus]
MTARHVTAARLHGSGSTSASKTTGDVRPGMSTWHVAIGSLVHQCAGALAEHRGEQSGVIAQRATEWVNSAARDTRVFGNLAKARAQITSLACAYLHRYAPDADADYLGAEIPFDGGRVDLVWSIPGLGVVIDELKTTAWVRLNVDASMLAQPQRYREFGVQKWGSGFAGVRFLPLRNPGEARFISADGEVHRLTDSPAATVRKDAA